LTVAALVSLPAADGRRCADGNPTALVLEPTDRIVVRSV
jgi:hypothetical protein